MSDLHTASRALFRRLTTACAFDSSSMILRLSLCLRPESTLMRRYSSMEIGRFSIGTRRMRVALLFRKRCRKSFCSVFNALIPNGLKRFYSIKKIPPSFTSSISTTLRRKITPKNFTASNRSRARRAYKKSILCRALLQRREDSSSTGSPRTCR